VDLREGPSFGAVFAALIDPSRAVFVPRGVGNAYQTLEADTAYTYLVNDHWSADAEYSFLNLADETSAIAWPIPLERAEISDKDRSHPRLADVSPISPRKILVLGSNGQLGLALRDLWGDANHIEYASRDDIDITSSDLVSARRWRSYGTIVNAAAYTAVDTAETPTGRTEAWRVNAAAVSSLARIADAHGITLVHISSDYVFDGTNEAPYPEDAPMSPLGVYGQSKAAGDLAAQTASRHYIVRTSWVIGQGHNFVRTMTALAEGGVNPRVVADQRGRLTFTDDIAAAIDHLLRAGAPFGVYNVSGSGAVHSWAEVARAVFHATGHDPSRVTDVTTEQYFADATDPIAPRPANSALDLSKIVATGFGPRDTDQALAAYLAR
jgi:dTDP-4-dehydrorhamnose 3,5-epimerase